MEIYDIEGNWNSGKSEELFVTVQKDWDME